MSPEYDKLVKIFKKKRPDILIARLDASINEDVSTIYDISSFPRVVLFHPGSQEIKSVFRGQRTAEIMTQYLEEHCPELTQNIKPLPVHEQVEEKKQIKEEKKEIKEEKKLEEKQTKKQYKYVEENKMEKNDMMNNTHEIEMIKLEIKNMKTQLNGLENEIISLRNKTFNFEKSKEMNEEIELINSREEIKQRMKIKKGESKKIKEAFFEKFTWFDFIIYGGILLFLIGTVITVRKIAFKKTKGTNTDHSKI